jgi:hypothetical protein
VSIKAPFSWLPSSLCPPSASVCFPSTTMTHASHLSCKRMQVCSLPAHFLVPLSHCSSSLLAPEFEASSFSPHSLIPAHNCCHSRPAIL